PFILEVAPFILEVAAFILEIAPLNLKFDVRNSKWLSCSTFTKSRRTIPNPKSKI
ncbi:hypothetical protein H1Q63_20640, partial [Desmonostoc muscorum CCALA 125]|nr:hypothetical protein [Desmonostoc muscorum CCALA 125]